MDNNKPRILVIDDDPNVRKTLSDILRVKGYEVASTENGATGIVDAQRVFANVVLIDLKLPDMSGIDVMVKIRANTPLTEAIILTGYASINTAVEATNKGAFSYLLKPYDIEKLLRHIHRALNRQKTQQEILRLASFPRMDPDPVIELDASGQVTYVNPAAGQLFPDLVAMGSKHPVLDGVADRFARIHEEGRREVTHQIAAGNLVYEQRIFAVPESNLIRINMLDITERVRTEIALSESEQRFKAIIENAQDGILLADLAEKKFYSGNPRICEMLGYSPEELTALGVADIHPEKDLPYVLEQYEKQARKEITLARDIPVKRRDGSLFMADITSFPIQLKGKEYLVGFFRDITERKAREAKTRNLVALLSTILTINNNLLIAKNEDEIFRFACDALKGLEDMVGVIIGSRMPDFIVEPVAWAGFDEVSISSLKIRWDDSEYGRGLMGTAVREGKPGIANDIEHDPRYVAWKDVVERWQLKSAAAVPLIADNEVMGVLAIYSGQRNAMDEELTKFLAEVANDIALAVRSSRLDKILHATLDHMRESMNSTVEAIARMVELRDPYTAGHERRVSQLACAIGKAMGLPERQAEGLRVIGYLHDIGKIAVPAEMLSKPTGLTGIEFAMVKAHVQAGYDILKDLEFPWPVAQAVLQHHERLDGSGYPQGLKDGEIILEAKILMVADVMEAMSSHRPYRPGLGEDAALDEISKGRGTHYDPDVVDACIKLIKEGGFVFE